MEKVAKIVFAALLTLIGCFVSAQTTIPPLERTVSLELNGESTKKALQMMEEQAGLNFGYRSDIVKENDHLQRIYKEKTVREVLDDLFQGELVYREKGNYIILKISPEPKATEMLIEGYVFSAETGDKIPYASLYDSTTLEAAISDEYGHYSLMISNRKSLALVASKYGYEDTIVQVDASGKTYQNIYLNPIIDTSQTAEDSTNFWKRLENWKIFKLSEEQRSTIRNFKDNFKSEAQFSLIPTIGTNGVLSPSMDVDYSFNLLGGLNGGVNVLEIGGLFNAVWDTVKYAQIAGGFNFVGGPQYGAQVAGIANLNGSSFDGAQVSGVLNLTEGPFYGFQGSGFGNIALDKVDGVQVAGFANYAGDSSDLVQVSPVANYVAHDSRGVQVSPVVNFAGKNFIGSQVSVLCNYAEDGFIGSQTGLFNVANTMSGTQFGFMNFNDSINGVSVGFFSFSRKGLHQLEISANELTYLNLAFKSGTNQFYNSFLGGVRFGDGISPTWSLGYGIGTSVRGGGRNRIFFDFQASNLFRENQFDLALNTKFTMSYQFHLANKVSLAIGPSANLFAVDMGGNHNSNYFQSLSPYTLYDRVTTGGLGIQGWVGGHVSMRLF